MITIELPRAVNILIDSTDWTQWVTTNTKKKEDMKRGDMLEGHGESRKELGAPWGDGYI